MVNPASRQMSTNLVASSTPFAPNALKSSFPPPNVPVPKVSTGTLKPDPPKNLFFQFEGIAEAWLQHDDWALFREMLRGNGDVDRYISDLSRPGALTASLNWYRANLAPRAPGWSPQLPPVEAPTLGIWSTNDHYLDGERMKMSDRFVKGPWRYEQIDGASHWIPLEASDQLNQLLIDWLV
jgi:pimeloyl-ACP methyl ester carboxylesterase